MSRQDPTSRPARLWQYQRERFPLSEHGPFLVAFTAAAFGAAHASGALGSLALLPFLGAVLSVIGGFLLIRLADEGKDAATDRRYRPGRPVPRGLVRPRELVGVGIGVVLLQAALAWASGPAALGALLAFWIWFALTAVEFGIPTWLSKRPLLYMLSHLPNVALLFLLAWAHAVPDLTWAVGPALGWGAAAAFGAGAVFEISRKLRAPAEEQEGVETYTAAWGRPRALAGVLAAQVFTLAAVVAVSLAASGPRAAALVAGAVLALSIAFFARAARRFAHAPSTRLARRTRHAGLVFPLAVFVVLGALPLWRLLG